jgi:hypothetical protein
MSGRDGRVRRPASVSAAVLAVLALAAPAPASAAPSADQRLVDAYAPIVMLRAQSDGLCDTAEEQFSPPTSVSTVLGNPEVALVRRDGSATRVVKRAPTATDIATLGPEYYFNLPGSPLNPGCKYARSFDALRRAGRAPALTYAHIARQNGWSGLAVQYWFYYYFNQFNDLHESDWEGMQIAFDADTAARALRKGPYEIVLFQHAGGEHADWDADKVEREGTHPVVYTAAGSHATFYDSALHLGNGQNGSGVGCDNTSTPLVTARPRAILLPDEPVPTGPFAWLTYTGRWGQREAGYNNGPTGPITKTVWNEPLTWMEGTRSASPTVPGGSVMGPSVAKAFCGTVASVTGFMNLAARTTLGAIGVALACALIVLVPASLTRWRPVSLEPLRQARALGQVLLGAGRLYARHAANLVLIGLTTLALIAAVAELQKLVIRALGGHGGAVSFTNTGSGIEFTTSAGLSLPLAGVIASAAVIAYVRDLDRGTGASYIGAWRGALGRLWRVVAVQLLATILVILLALTIIGIPFAIRKFVHWQFVQQEVLFEDRSIRDALRGSTRVVRGHWWHTAAVAATLWVLSQIPGPLLGFALLFTTLPVTTVNVVGAVVFAFVMPYVGVGRTLLYLDVCARRAAPAPAPSAVAAPAPAG